MVNSLVLQVRDDLPLREAVYYTVREGILMGRLEPEERLMEIHLAKELGVSRTPVREALRMLADDGLVTMTPNKGAVVAGISARDLTEVLEARLALEQLAVKKACGNITDAELAGLKEAAVHFREGLEKNDRAKSALADEEFHRIIAEASGNRTLVGLLEQLREKVFRYRLESLKDPESYGELDAQHEEIIRCLEKGEADAAREAMRAHIMLQMEINRSLLESIRGRSLD